MYIHVRIKLGTAGFQLRLTVTLTLECRRLHKFIFQHPVIIIVLSVFCLAVTIFSTFSDPQQRQRIFPLTSVSRSALRPTQPAIQCVPVFFFLGVKRDRDVRLTTNASSAEVKTEQELYYILSPLAPARCAAGELLL
jgi:hypothetical protein